MKHSKGIPMLPKKYASNFMLVRECPISSILNGFCGAFTPQKPFIKQSLRLFLVVWLSFIGPVPALAQGQFAGSCINCEPPPTMDTPLETTPAQVMQASVSTPQRFGAFVYTPGAIVSIPVQVDLSSAGFTLNDRVEVEWSCDWPAQFYDSANAFPLTDSDGDGRVDFWLYTWQLQEIHFTVRMQAPMQLNSGDHGVCGVRVSPHDGAVPGVELMVIAAAPTPFTELTRTLIDGISSNQVQRRLPGSLLSTPISHDPDTYGFYYRAITETSSGNFLATWAQSSNASGAEIRYTVLDAQGNQMFAPARLHGAPDGAPDIVFGYQAMSATTEGRVALAWVEYEDVPIYSTSTSWTLWLAVLDEQGNLVVDPQMVSQGSMRISLYLNPSWGIQPTLAVTEDQAIVIAWGLNQTWVSGYYQGPSDPEEAIGLGIYDLNGGVILAPAAFLGGEAGAQEMFTEPCLAVIRGSRVLLAYRRLSTVGTDIYYTVLDSHGGVVFPAVNLTASGQEQREYFPLAVQLSSGKILLAWNAQVGLWPSGDSFEQPRFTLLDESYQPTTGQIDLALPAENLRITALTTAGAGRGMIQLENKYVLVSPSGAILTPPTPYEPPTYGNAFPYTITTLAQTASTPGVDLEIQPSTPYGNGGRPGGTVPLSVDYRAVGSASASGAVLVAVLDPALTPVATLPPADCQDHTCTWALSEVDFLGVGRVKLWAALPNSEPGPTYPVTFTLNAPGDELPANDQLTVHVRSDLIYTIYLPDIEH